MTPAHSEPSHSVTAVILAGGRAQRMGGQDKALLPLAGQTLMSHVIAALTPQVGGLLLNSNRPPESYRDFGLPVIADVLPDQPGPLAGLLSAFGACTTPLVLAVPCDTPCLPPDLVQRLRAALEAANADVCSVHDGQQLHAAIILARRSVVPSLQSYLASGERKVQAWLRSQRLALADFSDQADAFRNINTPHELQAQEQRMTTDGC